MYFRQCAREGSDPSSNANTPHAVNARSQFLGILEVIRTHQRHYAPSIMPHPMLEKWYPCQRTENPKYERFRCQNLHNCTFPVWEFVLIFYFPLSLLFLLAFLFLPRRINTRIFGWAFAFVSLLVLFAS